MQIIGLAIAGHAFRVTGHPKAKQYDNPLTDLIDLMIAEEKAKADLAKTNQEKTDRI
jgi:hypothetical protein